VTRKKSDRQPLCLHCWYATQTRAPACEDSPPVRCSDCGRTTRDGLFIEISWQERKTVCFPAYQGE
jgi:hypothetical protein